jgi:hypothetical protein
MCVYFKMKKYNAKKIFQVTLLQSHKDIQVYEKQNFCYYRN